MIKLNAYDEVQELQSGEFPRLPAGGYVCIVKDISLGKSKSGKDMLTFSFDIAEGKFVGLFKNNDNPPKFFQLIFSQDGKTNPYFKGLLKNFEESNSGFAVNSDAFDEKSLLNKKIGVIFGDEERLYNGKVYTDAKPQFTVTVEKIRKNDFKIPELKRIEKPPDISPPANVETVDDLKFLDDEEPIISDKQLPF